MLATVVDESPVLADAGVVVAKNATMPVSKEEDTKEEEVKEEPVVEEETASAAPAAPVAPAPTEAVKEEEPAADEKPTIADAADEEADDDEAVDADVAAEELQEGLDAVPNLMDTGRKAFTLQNWETAVQVFGKAAEIVSSVYGPFALECAESMVWYGKALIRNAVAQAGLVDTKNADKKQVAGGVDIEAGPSGARLFFEDEEGDEDGEEEEPEAAAGPAEGEQEIETDETDDDFTLAWEALSVAAKIYEDQTTEDAKRKLADVYMLMGDCCLEDDNSTQAIDTFKKALDLKESYLEESNRELAEVHHLLGLAYEHDNLIDDAVDQVQKARGVLEKRMEVLKESVPTDNKGKGKATEPAAKAADEISELESLILELNAKLEDLQNLATQQAEGDAEAKKESLASTVAANAPVNDISNLVVKKKRRADDSTEGASENDAKRTKTERDGPSA